MLTDWRGLGVSRTKAFLAIIVVVLVSSGGYLYYSAEENHVSRTSTSGATTGTVVMSLGPAPRLLGPGVTMNYTLTLFHGSASGRANLSAQSPPGLLVRFNPSEAILGNSDVAVDVSIIASQSVSPGDYNIRFQAEWGSGSSNLTFRFTVVQHVVLLVGAYVQAGGFSPQNISVRPGETVTWLSIDPGGDEFGGLRQVRIVETNATSPTMSLYSQWSYTFTMAGTYHVEDPLNPLTVPEGLVIVG